MPTLYEKWRNSIGRDGPEYNIPKNTPGKEFRQFEDDLIRNLGYFEALELGFLKSKKSVKALKGALEKCNKSECLAYAKALLAIEDDPKHLSIILSFISDSKNITVLERINAIGLLGGVKHVDVFSTLEKTLYDTEYLVRYNAAQMFSYNSARRTRDDTILRNVKDFNKPKLQKLAGILRGKIYT